ncbi:hypothetical protein OIU77_007231 [Salix suchowensis]|uniref:Uncharacterized protein n=1 Tax=Salix suchowensis TaxID=1278906 RepID=A0ABQ9AGL2_9ROSI|nr:hypothetical protein OIU77_007231 [Salix suchowensis]
MFLLEIIAMELAGPPHDQITDHILPYLNQHVPLASLGIAGDNSISLFFVSHLGYLDWMNLTYQDGLDMGFGSLLILNHFLGSNSDTTQAQLRTEVLGLSLAAFSAALPYLGRFLKGSAPVDQGTLPQDAEQIFAMSQNISDAQKEDLAWATYILLRNTNSIAVLISIQGELCVRGYWKTPDNMSKDEVLGWFKEQIENIGLSDVKETLYFPRTTESEIWEMLPEGTRSLLVEPVLQATVQSAIKTENNEGFILLASSIGYAYSDKDRAWIRAIGNKFRGKSKCSEL